MYDIFSRVFNGVDEDSVATRLQQDETSQVSLNIAVVYSDVK